MPRLVFMLMLAALFLTPFSAHAVVDKMGAGHVIGFTPNPTQQDIPGELAQEAGVVWTREDFPWYLIQPGSQFDWTGQDNVVQNSVRHGLSILGLLIYVNRECSTRPDAWNYYIYPSVTDYCLNQYETYVRTTVSRYKDQVRHWQIWTATHDYDFWGFSETNQGLNEYYALIRRAYRAVKAADPTATVVLAAMRSDFLDAFLALPGAAQTFDVLAVDNYVFYNGMGAHPSAPETSILTALRLPAFHAVAVRLGGRPIWVTEGGWSTGNHQWALDPLTHAQYSIRSMLLQARDPDVDVVLCEAFHDYGHDWLFQFGLLLYQDYQPKPAFAAYKAMTAALRGKSYQGEQPPASPVQIIDNFETPQGYRVYTGGGARGTITRDAGVAFQGRASARINYALTADPLSAVVVVRDADLPGAPTRRPLTGQPTRIKMHVRGNGVSAPMIAAEFVDASGAVFNAMLGLANGTQWKELVFHLDGPPGTNSILHSASGPREIHYPITWNGFSIRRWDDSSLVGEGQVWIDNIRVEQGPSIHNLLFAGPTGSAHAIWSLHGDHVLTIPTHHTQGTILHGDGRMQTVHAVNGAIPVTAKPLPLFLVFDAVPGQRVWKTEVGVVNPDSTPLTGTLTGFSATGTVVWTSPVNLRGHGRRAFDVSTQAGALAPEIKTLRLDISSGTAVGYQKFHQEGLFRVGLEALPTANQGDILIPHMASNREWSTGISWTNTTNQSQTPRISFNTGQQTSRNIGPRSHDAFTVASLFNETKQPGINSARVSQARGLVGLLLFGGERVLSGVALSDASATTLHFPYIVDNTEWSTGLAVYNPGELPANLDITFHDAQGVALGARSEQISPGRKLTGNPRDLEIPADTAWLAVQSDQPVSGFALLGPLDGNQLGGHSVVNLAATAGVFPKLEPDGWTAIALVNISDEISALELEARTDDGDVAATRRFNVDPGQRLFANPQELFPGQNIAGATYLRFTATHPMVGLQLNGSSDNTMLDAIPALGSSWHVGSSVLYFPHIAAE